MDINIGCDMERDFRHKAKVGTDITIKTKSEHEIILCVREHGFRLVLDEKELLDFQDWKIVNKE